MKSADNNFRNWSNRQIFIAPSVLAADPARLGEEVKEVAEAGAEVLHLDIMDGHFVPNISFGPDFVASLRNVSDQLFDVHLMISDPRKYLDRFVKAGADHITFHVEVEDDIRQVIRAIHDQGCTAGLSLRPGTPVEAIEPYLDELDLVLVMTVEPGFGGQSFREDQLPKLAAFRKLIDASGRPIQLEVDGGITAETGKRVREAGANVLIAGSSVFKAKGAYRQAVDVLR